MNSIAVCVCTLLTVSGIAMAGEHVHFDVLLAQSATDPSHLATGAFNFEDFEVAALPPVRVYEYDLEAPGVGADLLTGELGFVSLSADSAALLPPAYTHLPGGVAVRVDFNSFGLGGGVSNLWYWDGIDDDADHDFTDDIDFQPAEGVSLALEALGGALTASVDGSAFGVPGFHVGTTAFDDAETAGNETGFLHLDLDVILDDLDADPLTLVPSGVYAYSVSFGFNPQTDPIYIVLNGGLGEEGEPAVEAVVAYIPEPGTLLLLAFDGVLLMRRRR